MTEDYLQGLSPYYVLNISTADAVNPLLDFDKLKSELNGGPIGIWMWQYEDLPNIFSLRWLDYMRDQGLDIGSCLIFYRDAHYLCPSVHVDIHNHTGKPSHYAINWVLNPEDDSEMVWYNYPGKHTEGSRARTPADTPYMAWELDHFTGPEICRRIIGNHLTLVNTSMPHNVETKTQSRWAFSARFKKDANNNAGHSWQQAVGFFKPWIIET